MICEIIAAALVASSPTPAASPTDQAARPDRERVFRVSALAAPRDQTVGHPPLAYGITGQGNPVVLYPPTFEPAWLVHDVSILASR